MKAFVFILFLIFSFNLQAQKPTVSVFPNPVTETINVNIDNGLAAKVSLIDILGKTIATYQLMDNQVLSIKILDLNLENGIYFLRIVQNDFATIKKIAIKN